MIDRFATIATAVAVGLALLHVVGRRRAAQARAAFDPAALAAEVRAQGAATGKPRGLRWLDVAADGEPAFLRRGGAVAAAWPVLVRFEPEPGGGLEDNPAAGEPRPAVVVCRFAGGRWVAGGPPVLNLTLDRVVAGMTGYRPLG